MTRKTFCTVCSFFFLSILPASKRKQSLPRAASAKEKFIRSYSAGYEFQKRRYQWQRRNDVAPKILELSPSASVIMITAYADVKTAVDAVKAGAVDFVEKPWRNEKLLTTILSAYKLSQSKQQVRQLEQRQQVLTNTMEQSFGRDHWPI